MSNSLRWRHLICNIFLCQSDFLIITEAWGSIANHCCKYFVVAWIKGLQHPRLVLNAERHFKMFLAKIRYFFSKPGMSHLDGFRGFFGASCFVAVYRFALLHDVASFLSHYNMEASV